MKAKELRQAYQKAREANNQSSADLQTCHFYKELHSILSRDPTTTPNSTEDNSEDPESQAPTVNSKEEEVVDEEEEKEYGRPPAVQWARTCFDSTAIQPVLPVEHEQSCCLMRGKERWVNV
ncbi:hypothetical protein UY3_03867 [Chelonia mydas]|uniref:Uncharacterized protein n=1 Tax=Chelonia mydas TaxID=8469 RepID=M7BT34_CHEMY|nr:hypothetical protein UY3_03867 [Chelonia mydas]